MEMHKIEVKSYMLKKSSPDFDFMAKWNNDIPMPLKVMVGTIVKETKGMVYMKLHGDIFSEKTCTCMKCGRPLTNPVSQYFGIGPECGGHNYVNPFNSDEELKQAVAQYKAKLNKLTWEGWVIKSAIIEDIVIGGKKEAPQKPEITIEIKDGKFFEGQSAFVKFDYNVDILNKIRLLSSRKWHKEEQVWEIPQYCYNELISQLQEYHLNVLNAFLSEENKEVDINFNFKTKPFKHQKQSFAYGLNHDRWLLADEQGLGKTKQVIDIAMYKKEHNNYEHCLIVCGVNGLKWNWQNEISIHSDEVGHILGQGELNRKLKISSNADKLGDLINIDKLPYFIITNVESLRYKVATGRKIKVRGKVVDEYEYPITDELLKLCQAGKINMIAFDEFHKCKNPTSEQGSQILRLKAETMIAMTGTPLMNAPLDLYVILKWLGYEKHSYFSFKNHYCVFGGYGGYEIIKYQNLPELQNRLDMFMLRRLKSDVFDLPEKTYVDEYVEMTPKQSRIYFEATAEIMANIDQIKMATNPLSSLIRMRQATGYTGILSSKIKESAKLDRMEELVDEAIENGKKVVIFSNWTQMTDVIQMRLSKKYNGVVITGQTNDMERQLNVDMFQNDDNCKYIVGTIGAMGTGLTLTAGAVEIFLDEPWNNALKEQAVDRCHRIGTTENVTIYTLLCKDTIDEKIHDLVLKKGAIANAMVDGKVDNDTLINYLLS